MTYANNLPACRIVGPVTTYPVTSRPRVLVRLLAADGTEREAWGVVQGYTRSAALVHVEDGDLVFPGWFAGSDLRRG